MLVVLKAMMATIILLFVMRVISLLMKKMASDG
jgi:hypothetical protein